MLRIFLLVAVISIFVNNQIIWYLSYGLYFSIGYIVSRRKLCVCAKKVLYSALIIGFMLSLIQSCSCSCWRDISIDSYRCGTANEYSGLDVHAVR